MDPTLSVIVASYRRRDALELCLSDLTEQDATEPFEVVIVMQEYPDDSADELTQRFGNRLNMNVVAYPEGIGTGRARNIGLSMARGDVVAFLDDDVRLPRHWIRVLLTFYADPKVGAVGGFVDHPGHFNPARNAAYRVLGLTSNRYKIDWGGFNVGPASHPESDQPAGWLSGGNMSFRRSVLAAVGGFDEALGTFWHEDADLSHRVARSGWRVLSSRKITVEHYPSGAGKDSFHLQMRERERSRVLFVWKAIGDKPLWRTRYAARLLLQAAAMSVVGIVKRDLRIPVAVLRGAWEGYTGLPKARAASEARKEIGA